MIVLDSSFLVKLVLEENDSAKARELARLWSATGDTLITLDIALPEALNAIWKHCLKIGDLTRSEALRATEDLLRVWKLLNIYSSRELAEEAFKLALEENITVYDALYIQLARSTRGSLATFDEKLSRIARKHGVATYP